MNESWMRVDALLQAALERPQAEREAFVRSACGGDAALDREVRSLLDSYDQAGTFLERPAVELDEEIDRFVGRDVSHYHIVERLGGGGMGVVYRAQDQRLHRFVALKFLADEFANDPECISRFRREGRAASALNHPNICTIYDIGDSDGHPFLVMEHLEGATLKHRLTETRMTADRVLALGLEILEGLEAAHNAGIVHRDIKPANIFITNHGHAKILDFGLAKARSVAEGTMASVIDDTKVGAVLGTAAYMAPEQARGEDVDQRTDLWAFGIVLYEMLTGARPIAGIGPSADVPAPFAAIIARCLEPDRERRYQSAGEVRAAMTKIRRGHRRVWLTAAAAIVLLVGSGLVAANVADIRDRWTGSGRGHAIQSIAVLPLVNLTGDPSQDYLTDGLTDELITKLARQTSMRVASRSSVMRYKGTRLPARDVARELAVDSVLEGSVTRVSDKLHITAQFIDAANDAHPWVQSYDLSFEDALTLPGELSRTVAREAGLDVSPVSPPPRPVNPAAHDAYMHGRYMWFSPGSDGLEYFKKATELQDDYALAWSGLADAYITAVGRKAPREVMPLAAAAARKAVALGDDLPETHLSLAASFFYGSWDLKRAQVEISRTLTINPNFAEAHHLYGYVLNVLGRKSEAIAEQRRSMELDSNIRPWALGRAYAQARQFDAAVQELRMRDSVRPGSVRRDLIKAYWYAGMWREWVDEMAKELRESNDETSAKAVERAFDRGGKTAAAEWLLRRVEARARDHYVSFNELAYANARLQRKDTTLAYLERAYDERYPFLITLKSDPIYDFLQHDERYLALLRKIGIP